jgi:hypothetical protein
MGLDSRRVTPYIYNLVNYIDDKWPTEKATDPLSGTGPTIAAGADIEWPVRLDPDFIFKMEWIRFTVYYLDSQRQPSAYLWYEPVTGWSEEFMDINSKIGTPLVRFLSISVSLIGNDQYILGAPDPCDQVPRRLSPATMQGFDTGIGQINMPYLCPRSGIILLKIKNNHPVKTLIVGGCIYGHKIHI